MRKIVDLMLSQLERQLKEKQMHLEVDAEAKEFLIEQGFDPNYGARPLRRAIQRLIEDKLSESILHKQFGAGVIVVVDVEPDPDSPGHNHLVFRAVEGFTPPATPELAGTAE